MHAAERLATAEMGCPHTPFRSELTHVFEPISQNQAISYLVLKQSPLIRCLPFGSEKATPPEKPPLPQIKCRHPIYVAQETPDYSFNRLSEMPAIPLGLSPSFLSAFMTWVITARYAHIIMALVYLRRRNVAISCTRCYGSLAPIVV